VLPTPLYQGFDFKEPDYIEIIRERCRRLKDIRDGKVDLVKLKLFYKEHIPQFIEDWGMTFDPRNVPKGLPTLVPFVLYKRQHEWMEWRLDLFRRQKDGITEKSRETGVSWMSVTCDVALAIFNEGFVAGYGSRTEDEVDAASDPDSLFWKAREFIMNLPPEFRAGWSRRGDAHLRISFPQTGSTIKGDAGKNIGRGGRASVYTVDESAYVENPEAVDAALSQTTNCRQDISSVNGMANSFAQRRHSGKIEVFTFHWRDDPRKDEEWYKEQNERLTPLIVAQEIDINYMASAQGVLIPGDWVQASVDADKALGFGATGIKRAGLDVADQGVDKCALIGRRGVVMEFAEQWSGQGSDVFASTAKAIAICDERGYVEFDYDGNGVGADVRGAVRVLNEARGAVRQFRAYIFNHQEIIEPDKLYVEKKTNADMFANHKAQAYWELRTRFMKTYRMVKGEAKYSFDELIVIRKDMPNRERLLIELSQPTYELNNAGKVVVDKDPDGSSSPNLADATMICYARRRRIIAPDAAAVERSRMPLAARRRKMFERRSREPA